MLDFYDYSDTIFKLAKKYKSQKINKVLSKYLKHTKSVAEIEEQYDELKKYLG